MTRRLLISGLLAAGLAAAAGPTAAIIRRHDVADARHVEAAAAAPRPVVLARAPRGASDGMGTFFAPGWIITAAHVAERLAPGAALPDDPALVVEQVILHPAWRGPENDIALVRVRGEGRYPIVSLCPGGDQAGAHLLLVGAGDHGDGVTGPVGHDRQLRAAENTIDAADGLTLRFDFDRPPDALPLEGVGGPGDSGGPAFLQRPAGLCVAGVSSGQISERGARGRYGAVEVYTRVAAYGEWIRTATGAG